MDKAGLIEAVIFLILAICYSTGILILVYPDLRRFLFQIEERKKRQNEYRVKRESNIDKELRYMLKRSGLGITPKMFKAASLAMFLIVSILLVPFTSMLICFLVAALVAGAPYLCLKMRLEQMRSRGSLEADELVSNFLIQYRICNNNIEETIEKVIASGKIKATKKPLYAMLLTLTSTRNKLEIKDATEAFGFSIGTLWAKMLGHSIYYATINKVDISLAIEDILNQLKEARVVAEERKRINAESTRMIWMIPIFYFGSIFLAIKSCNISLADFIHNQLGTPEGVSMAILMLVLSIADIYLISLTKQKKFDF